MRVDILKPTLPNWDKTGSAECAVYHACIHCIERISFFWDKSNKLSVWPLKSYIDFDIGIDKEEEDLVCVFVILQDVIEPITLLEKHYVCSCCYLFQGPCFLQFFQHLEVRIISYLI